MDCSSDSTPCVTAAAVTTPPSNEFERFLAALPEMFRNECRGKLVGSDCRRTFPSSLCWPTSLIRTHRRTSRRRISIRKRCFIPTPPNNFSPTCRDLPTTISARIEAKFHELLARFTAPVEKLERTSTDLTRNVEALPVLLLSNRRKPTPAPKGFWKKLPWATARLFEFTTTLFTDRVAWLAAAGTSFCLAAVVTVTTLAIGAHPSLRLLRAKLSAAARPP